MKEDIANMISAVRDGDTTSAAKMFTAIISDKVADRLEDYREKVGSSLLGTQVGLKD